MTDLLAFIVVIIAFAISSYGYGRIFYKYVYSNDENYYAYCITLGLAVWIFIAGVFNYLHLAFKASLWLLFFSGLIISAVFFIQGLRRLSLKQSFPKSSGKHALKFKVESLLYFFPIISFIFLVATLIPSDAFNFHDDFHTYIQRPIRMLQTGTLGGDPFSLMGIDSLGSQAFFQSFIISVFPIDYLNGFDAIFCFSICLLLIIEISAKLKVHIFFTLISLLIFIFINPLLVNLSSVYSGSLMILALIFSAVLLIGSFNQPVREKSFFAVLPFSLFCASLVTLKTTYIVYCTLFFLFFFFLLFVFSKNRKQIIRGFITSATLILLAIIPWVMVAWSKLQGFLYNLLFSSKPSAGILPGRNSFSDISIYKQLYGDINFWDYNFVVIIFVFVLFISIFQLARNRMEGETPYNVLLFSISAAGILSYFVLVYLFNNGGLPRYTFPILIALPSVLLLILSKNSQDFFKLNRLKDFRSAITISILLIISACFFSDALIFRLKRLYTYKSPVSFEIDQKYIKYTKAVIEEDSRYKLWMQHLQSKTKSNETILSWVSDPFYLDFKRNKIFTIDKPLLISSWLPYGGDAVFLEKFLQTWGVRYVIWGYDQPGMLTADEYEPMLVSSIPQFQKIGQYGLYFINSLKKISGQSNIIFDDGAIILFEIGSSGNSH